MITDTQLIAEQLRSETQIDNPKIIADLIAADLHSKQKARMKDGVNYYKGQNTEILNKSYEYYGKNGYKYADENRANTKLTSGYTKILIDQKIHYLMNDMIIKNIEKPIMDKIDMVVDVNETLRQTGKEASKKGLEWMHPYIDARGEFKVINISAEECIPIFDTAYQDELISMIRYYQTKVIDSKGLEVSRYRVEWWDSEKVSFYNQDDNGLFFMDMSILNPRYHWNVNTYFMNMKLSSEGHSWGRVPFIPFYNNDTMQTDLEPVKAFIDAYDLIASGLIDNLVDLQDAIVVLRGYAGMNADDLDELILYLKKYKIISVDEKGGVDYLKVEIPIEARSRTLEILEKCIYQFGQGVDVQKLDGGSITNVYIKSKYALLDLKCNDFENEAKKALKQLLSFVKQYLNIPIPVKLDTVFNRAMIINKSDIINDAIKSKELVSKETALSMHPDVKDVPAEIARLEKEKEDQRKEQELIQQTTFDMQQKSNEMQQNNAKNEVMNNVQN